MSNIRYLEIDSTYRNRNLWPDPSNFEIEISQTGTKNKNNALDPVSLSTPIKVWKSKQFNTNSSANSPGNPDSSSVRVKVQASSPSDPNIGAISSGITFVVVACLG